MWRKQLDKKGAEIGLDKFIASTLTQILGGIDQAKDEAAKTNRKNWISPPIVTMGAGEEKLNQTVRAKWPDGRSSDAHLVWFDVAVTASRESEGQAGAKLAVVSSLLSVGAEGAVSTLASTVSRIKFTIPMFLSEPPSEST